MTTYESELKTISSSGEMVFNILSDLTNLQKLASNPAFAEKAKDIQYNTDSCSFAVDGFGRVGFRIVERTPITKIVLVSENAPVSFHVDVVIGHLSENESTLKLLLKAELPAMIKMMVGSKLQDGVNSIAELLAKSLAPNP
jgi:hypothetical protein